MGNHYKLSNGVVTKYYFAGTQRIAMRKGGVLTYMLSDHLGSTSLMTNASGAVISETRYTAWGEVRYQAGTTSTGYTYTGQYSNTADFGLMYYNARWYDPALGRFTQADTIVPAGVQGYDRYAYVNNNPVRYTDPSGHDPILGDFLAGFVIELVRTNMWFSPYHQEKGAIHNNESDAMLAGRLVADVTSAAIAAAELSVGVGGEGGGILACATGVGCPGGGGFNYTSCWNRCARC